MLLGITKWGGAEIHIVFTGTSSPLQKVIQDASDISALKLSEGSNFSPQTVPSQGIPALCFSYSKLSYMKAHGSILGPVSL